MIAFGFMKIGILSDTHGDAGRTKQTADYFADCGVGAVFHCGDIGDSVVLSELAAVFQPLETPVYVVLGNCDLHQDWRFFPSNIGVQILGRFGEVEIDGHRIAFLHGDDRFRFLKAVSGKKYDLVFNGHTHVLNDEELKGTRCINPGSVGRGHPCSAAVLDLEDGTLETVLL